MQKIFLFGMIKSFLLVSLVHCQHDNRNLEKFVSSMAGDIAKSYVAPLVSGFGSSLNSGWFHRTPAAKKFGFNLEIGIVGMATPFSKRDKTFSASSTTRLDSTQAAAITSFIYANPAFNGLTAEQLYAIQQQLIQQITASAVGIRATGATAAGSETDSLRLRYAGADVTYLDPRDNQTHTISLSTSGLQATLPVTGLGLPLVGLAAFQITVGTVYGTQFTFRFLPPRKSDKEIGNFNYFGWGFQHNPAIWSEKKLPVDLSIAMFTQTMRQGNFFEMRASAIGFTAGKQYGKRLLNFSPYAGLMFEKSYMKFTYDYLDAAGQSERISIKLNGENQIRFTVGASMRILIGNLNVDYSFAQFSAYSAGLTFAL
ncbi:hypothetical protein F9K33_00180 [bacterium]|nr:MAG: hypothetical protein F9K33_00180 [bacterium]